MFTAPSVSDILKDLRNSVKSEVNDTDPWIWPNNLVPTLKAIAQALRAAYLRIQFVHEQAFVSTAKAEYLDFHGIQTGGLSRNPATYAQGELIVGLSAGAITIPDGTVLYRSDNTQYVTVGSSSIIRDGDTVTARALDSGERSNLDAGATLTPVIPVIGATSFTVSDSGLIGGADE